MHFLLSYSMNHVPFFPVVSAKQHCLWFVWELKGFVCWGSDIHINISVFMIHFLITLNGPEKSSKHRRCDAFSISAHANLHVNALSLCLEIENFPLFCFYACLIEFCHQRLSQSTAHNLLAERNSREIWEMSITKRGKCFWDFDWSAEQIEVGSERNENMLDTNVQQDWLWGLSCSLTFCLWSNCDVCWKRWKCVVDVVGENVKFWVL